MEIHLRSLTSQQVTPIRSHRLLKVNSQPCAYLAPHADGYRLFALTTTVPILVNNVPIESSTVLMVGDELRLQKARYVIDSVDTTDAETFEAGLEQTVCRVSTVNDERAVLVRKQLIVGTHSASDFVLPLKAGDEPAFLGMLARVRNRWLLYDFNYRQFASQPLKMPWTPIQDGDELELGAQLLSFSILSEAEAGAYEEADTVALDQTDSETSTEPEEEEEVPVRFLRTERDEEPGSTPIVPIDYDPLAPLMIQYCLWLKKAIADSGRGQPITHVQEVPLYDPAAKKLNALLRKLAQNPRDRVNLTNFAEFARAQDYRQARRIIIKELCKLNPNNEALTIGYIEACYEVSQLPSLTTADKLRALNEAEQYAQQLSDKGCQSAELHDLRLAVASDKIVYQL